MARSKPRPSSSTSNRSHPGSACEIVTRTVASAPAALGRFSQGLGAAEVDRRLHVGRARRTPSATRRTTLGPEEAAEPRAITTPWAGAGRRVDAVDELEVRLGIGDGGPQPDEGGGGLVR